LAPSGGKDYFQKRVIEIKENLIRENNFKNKRRKR
jgi:hypothetical protein